jgi:hypothetical protein
MITPETWIAFTITFLVIASILVGRHVYEAFRYTREKRIALEAQRHMLRFCKNPTRRNWEAAWDFITDHEVKLGGLNWPLVERFTKTAVATNFPLDAQPS